MKRLIILLAVLFFSGCGDTRDIPASAPKPTLKAWVSCGGQSMLPTFPERSLVEAEFGVPYDALKVGDTALSWDYTRTVPRILHHRIVGAQGGNYIMQGDNPVTNPVADRPWLTRETFIARTTGKHTQVLVFQ